MKQPIVRTPIHRAEKGRTPSLKWAKWVEDSIRRLIDIPTPPVRPLAGGRGALPPFWTAISRVPESDPAEHQVTVELGYLTYQNAGAEASTLGPVGYIVPKIATVSMEDSAVEPIALPDVVSYVYLRVKTDADGIPKFDDASVTVEAFDTEQQSVHHVRPYPGGTPVEGDYFFLLLETESNGGTPAAPVAKRRITGNRHMPNQLIEIENVGGEIELYKAYAEGADEKHQFRTLEQLTGSGKPIIKPEDPLDDTIKFRGIKEKASSPQVRVNAVDADDEIEVRGNGFDQNFAGVVRNLAVTDGLVTAWDEVSDGWWGTITFEFINYIAASTITMVQTWENGILVGVTHSSGYVSGDGTEGTPGVVEWITTDTDT